MEKTFKYAPFVLIAITLAVFFPTFFNDFQRGWDDQWAVLDHEYVVNHSLNDLTHHFTHFHLGQYMPVNTLLYIGIYKLFGFDPSAFHAASLIIHILNVLLVYYTVKIIIHKVKPSWPGTRVQGFSFFTALVFATHPLQVEPVAWVSASKIVLYALFFLLGVWLYIRYINTGKFWLLAGVALCYLFAYGSKEQGIIFPLNLVAFDYIFGRYKNLPVTFSSLKERVFVEKTPFLAIAIFLYWFSVSNNLGTLNLDTYPIHQRLLFGMGSFMDYVFRFIAPVKLYYFYFFPIEAGESLPLYYWAYPVLIIICLAFIWHNHKRKNSLVIFGSLLFVINILLVLHIVPMPRKMVTADRYMYFSIIGLALTTTWLGHYLYLKFASKQKLLTLFFASWLLFLAGHSHVRTGEWKDSESIKNNVTELVEKRKANKKAVVNNPLDTGPDGSR